MSEKVGIYVNGELLENTSSINLEAKRMGMTTEEFKGILNAAGAAEPMEIMNRAKPKEITIKQVANGYVVHVGCEAFVFETAEKMMNEISGYLNHPEATEEAFYKGELFDFQKSK